MDESLIYLKEKFALQQVNLATYSPLTLAYIGDAVYELVIRTILVEEGNSRPNRLHRRASQMVKAGSQAAMIQALQPLLTEEEEQIYLRGRNAKSATMAKHATMQDYRRATGFEALIGYLYLKGEQTRLIDLVHEGMKSQGFLPREKEEQ